MPNYPGLKTHSDVKVKIRVWHSVKKSECAAAHPYKCRNESCKAENMQNDKPGEAGSHTSLKAKESVIDAKVRP